jgi:hypothetical protein
MNLSGFVLLAILAGFIISGLGCSHVYAVYTPFGVWMPSHSHDKEHNQ